MKEIKTRRMSKFPRDKTCSRAPSMRKLDLIREILEFTPSSFVINVSVLSINRNSSFRLFTVKCLITMLPPIPNPTTQHNGTAKTSLPSHLVSKIFLARFLESPVEISLNFIQVDTQSK